MHDLVINSSSTAIMVLGTDGRLGFSTLHVKPSRVIDLTDRVIYYFEKPGPKQRGSSRDCAYICHLKEKGTFTMAYHPLDRDDQVVKDLKPDQIAAAVQDLIDAGF